LVTEIKSIFHFENVSLDIYIFYKFFTKAPLTRFMADNNNILLPLGYRTSSEQLRKYGYRHGLQRTKASMIVGSTSEEEIVDEATAIFVALNQAKAPYVDWVASTDAEGNDVMYI
jgi:hypothetical protein